MQQSAPHARPCTAQTALPAHRAFVSAPRPRRWKPTKRAAAFGRNNETPSGAEANTILDAFFLGRAFAETVNERLGAALGDALSEVSKRNAEAQYAIRSFQQEVQQRADREKEARTGLQLGTIQPQSQGRAKPYQPTSYSSNGQAYPAESMAAPDVQELVDELRAEVASTKAQVQKLKAKSATTQV